MCKTVEPQPVAIDRLLDEYFALGVAEGAEGSSHDNEAGDAQRVRSSLDATVEALRSERDALREALEEIADMSVPLSFGDGILAVTIARAALATQPDTQPYHPAIIHYEEGNYSQLVLEDCPTITGRSVVVEPIYKIEGERELIGFQWSGKL